MFGTADIADPSDPAYLMTIRDRLTIGMDTSPRRTAVAFYGMDSQGRPTTAAMLELDSSMPGFTAAVHGFREPRINQSNLLNDPQFAAQVAANALYRMALPQYTLEFGTYFLPALYPLDQCDVEEDVMLRKAACG